jgi:hypothetical protein
VRSTLTPAIQAIRAIQHVVQDHGDKGTRLGSEGSPHGMEWFGRLLGWTWPPSYLEILAVYDGVMVQDAIVYSFSESIESFMFFHDQWHRPNGFWPVGGDGCGNHYALSFGQRNSTGDCSVVMIYQDTPETTEKGTSYADFIIRRMRDQCERVGCTFQPG